ncbi:MAG: hypothetical protein KGL69_08565 [Alphaproteobacteria bacterium]|nr:hypothetical protein [Alphaproteobacteria bacterium]
MSMFYQLEQIKKTFADQFEQEGDRLVFRKNLRAAPVEVTPAERDFLVRQFGRHVIWLGVLTAALTVLVIVGICVFTFQTNTVFSEPQVFLAVAFIVAPVMAAGVWVWNAPGRVIAGRSSVGQARTSDEMKRLGMARMTWARLGGVAFLGFATLLKIDWHSNLAARSNLGWLSLSVFVVGVSLIQSIRKFLYERKK